MANKPSISPTVRPVVLALAMSLGACSAASRPPQRSATGAPSTQTTPGVGFPSPVGDGQRPDADGQAPVTVPAGATAPSDIVAALEAQREGRSPALYWRHLLLHAAASDAYLYIADPSKTDLASDTRTTAIDKALRLLRAMELWRTGQPRPQLPDFPGVADELATRSKDVAKVEVAAANAARSTEGVELIDALVVYRPVYTDGSTDRIDRVIVVMDQTLSVMNAYYF